MSIQASSESGKPFTIMSALVRDRNAEIYYALLLELIQINAAPFIYIACV